MPLPHDEVELLLVDYNDDLLRPDRAAQVEAHLQICEACRSKLAHLLALDLREAYEGHEGAVEPVMAPAPAPIALGARRHPVRTGLLRDRGVALAAALALAVGLGAGRLFWGGRIEGQGHGTPLVALGEDRTTSAPARGEVPVLRVYHRRGGVDYQSDGRVPAGCDLVIETIGATPFGLVNGRLYSFTPEGSDWIWSQPPLDDSEGWVIAVMDGRGGFDPVRLTRPGWQRDLTEDGIPFATQRVVREMVY